MALVVFEILSKFHNFCSCIFTDNDVFNPRLSAYLPLFNNPIGAQVQTDGESVNTEAVKIFLNILTPRKVAEQLTLIDAVCIVYSIFYFV